ncbi:carboxymuconolactone decarboxylase family protein [Paractinoplanes lichenicola]|uniref:Carboxymuconolactone decarboxylase family protein n=1 Tax=Paractinoplanes lichenicola TaxID=2802976 RepID=A0ABS1VIB6_9ACTN|nr:carboxymuconolactone decarboxylase family protein [Actinoplanes lichenicola]MBL7254453.1 carboxymuconolactone decarboxylase family protein [Actinoplanes lichenicola]
MFIQHTLESAPAASRPLMASTVQHLGHLPGAVALLAESPELLGGFLQASKLFEATTLDPLAREVVVMVIAARNQCRVCLAMHTGRLRQLNADAELISALRTGVRPADLRLAALHDFTLQVLATAGEADLTEFLAAGFTTRNALEVVLGIGTYTMSTLANRMVGA